jgi:NADH:ubiquinone oxidoreductase subunit 2 (subunit N)
MPSPALAPGLALALAALLVSREAGGRLRFEFAPLAGLLPLAAAVAVAPYAGVQWPALATGVVVAMLARNRDSLFHSECALKLVWVMGAALALSWAGVELLTLATGTPVVIEQWAVLQVGLDPRFLWSTALSLSLLVGLVLLGCAPFHFWPADLLHGARPWLAPLAVASLQVSGGGWLIHRLNGIEGFPPGARLTAALLGYAAAVAFLAGSATLIAQRRPERRVGTLASLNGALVLASIATVQNQRTAFHYAEFIGPWSAHLVLALTGAAALVRFVPVSQAQPAAAPVLFRRHPWSGMAGLFALFSLAGVPGTPGAELWLTVARDLAASGRLWLLLAIAAAWVAAFGSAIRQFREAFGIAVESPIPPQPVPWQVRATLWASALGLAALALG